VEKLREFVCTISANSIKKSTGLYKFEKSIETLAAVLPVVGPFLLGCLSFSQWKFN
jgi:hypothetical protein